MGPTAFPPSHSPSHHKPTISITQKRKTMSVTQTYFLAHKARGKLSSEAARPDHNLRLLVGHANLLDSLMLDLAEAEKEQESWFNQSVRGASKNADRRVQWADRAEEDWEADSDSSGSDSDFDDDEDEDVDMADTVSLTRVQSNQVVPSSPKLPNYEPEEEDEDEGAIEDDDEEDYEALTLTRSPSHPQSPPELDLDSESSEDELMPPSPPCDALPTFAEKKTESTPPLFGSKQEEVDQKSFYDEGYYLPARNPARLISSVSVY